MDLFHDGERAVQRRAGETAQAELNSRMIAPSIMAGALPFIARQPWAILGGADAEGRLWASALVGGAGFAQAAPDGSALDFELDRAPTHPEDPLLASHPLGQARGSLFIELATRRRLRVNGRIAEAPPGRLRLAVEEAFPNCPKYIQKRSFEGAAAPAGSTLQARRGEELGAPEQAAIASSDTGFLATVHPERGVDLSHRGGRPGFIEVLDAATLRLPDYPGNGLFQSFGNLEVDPRLGLLLPDFRSGAQLHLSGRGRLLWDQPDPEGRSAGTGRFLEIRIERWVLTPPAAAAPRWSFPEASPYNP